VRGGNPLSAEMARGGYTHIQILCCHAVLKPLATLPAAKLALSVDEVTKYFVCSECRQRATPARVALWKHGMRRFGS
jgi:hypothetical protein